MASMDKETIELQYKSYEEIARAFGFPGAECTEIYLYCNSSSQNKPSHYKMIRRSHEKESMFTSPYVHNAQLAWSKSQGSLIPYKAALKEESFNSENNAKTDVVYQQVQCERCGHSEFEYDSYFDEYSCKKCGWTAKSDEKIEILHRQQKDKIP